MECSAISIQNNIFLLTINMKLLEIHLYKWKPTQKSKLWEGHSPTDEALAISLEKAFGCCAWDANLSSPASNCTSSHPDSGYCDEVIQPKVEKY
jgi:hypothetical protein